MFQRFNSFAFHLPLIFVALCLCGFLRPSGEPGFGQTIAGSVAAHDLTEIQQGADAQSADPKTSADDTDPLFPIVQHGKWGYMDKTGKVVIAPQYYNAYPFTEGNSSHRAVCGYRGESHPHSVHRQDRNGAAKRIDICICGTIL
jgi:hypothetical protein